MTQPMNSTLTPSPRHSILVPEETWRRAEEYLASLRSGKEAPGKRLQDRISSTNLATMSIESFFGELSETRKPQVFAESDVYGDGRDWTLIELGLLGDVSVVVPVTIFDDGVHSRPSVHQTPFTGTLVYTPGALLRNGKGFEPADQARVVNADGQLCDEGYYDLYECRLLPVFQYVNAQSSGDRPAFVTIPGLGCGQFAGAFEGTLGVRLERVLQRFLEKHGASFPNIKAVYFDPYSECGNARHEIHGISFFVRPFTRRTNGGKSQLCQPTDYEEASDDFSRCHLFSVVAWDHVSWPGNDFYLNCRCTDDGVKAAATNSMEVLTGVAGSYDESANKYLPSEPFIGRQWKEVVEKGQAERGLRLWDPAVLRRATPGDSLGRV